MLWGGLCKLGDALEHGMLAARQQDLISGVLLVRCCFPLFLTPPHAVTSRDLYPAGK